MELMKFFKRNKPKSLKHYLNIEFKDALIPVEMPNVGTYKSGSRTKLK